MDTDRVTMLEFQDREDRAPTRKRIRQLISYGIKLIDRRDIDTGLFASSASGLTFVIALNQHRDAGAAFASAMVILFTVPTLVYGARVFGHVAPETAETVTQFARNMQAAPALVTAHSHSTPAPPISTADREQQIGMSHEDKWRQALRRFLSVARLVGSFSIRKLAKERRDDRGDIIPKYVSEPGWKVLNKILRDLGILATRRVDGRAQTWYADGWDYGRAVYHCKHGRLALPEGDPPEITF